MSLMRFDPFAGPGATRSSASARAHAVPMDAVRSEEGVTLYFDVPGVNVDDIELDVDHNELSIRVTRRWDRDADGGDVAPVTLVQERFEGEALRQVLLGESLDPDRLTATLDRGVLEIAIPTGETSRARRVRIDEPAPSRGTAIDAALGGQSQATATDQGSDVGRATEIDTENSSAA